MDIDFGRGSRSARSALRLLDRQASILTSSIALGLLCRGRWAEQAFETGAAGAHILLALGSLRCLPAICSPGIPIERGAAG